MPPGRDAGVADEPGDAVRDDAGLSGAGPGEHEQRAARMDDGLPLRGVQRVEQLRRWIHAPGFEQAVTSCVGKRGEGPRLLDRDALGEVARLVDVAAPQQRDVVGERAAAAARSAAARAGSCVCGTVSTKSAFSADVAARARR